LLEKNLSQLVELINNLPRTDFFLCSVSLIQFYPTLPSFRSIPLPDEKFEKWIGY